MRGNQSTSMEEFHRKQVRALSDNATLIATIREVRAKGHENEHKVTKLLAKNDVDGAKSLSAQIVGWDNAIKLLCNTLGITLKPEV